MRLWSLHPRYLDRQGLIALWREALLAQAVLAGRTKGYRQHPQLTRFRDAADPRGCLARYLDAVAAEASSRGYAFDAARIDDVSRGAQTLTVTSGQLALERTHLATKLALRSPADLAQLPGIVDPHPLFARVGGPPEAWERTGAADEQGS